MGCLPIFGCNKYLRDFVSHPNGLAEPPARGMQDQLRYKTTNKCKSTADVRCAERRSAPAGVRPHFEFNL